MQGRHWNTFLESTFSTLPKYNINRLVYQHIVNIYLVLVSFCKSYETCNFREIYMQPLFTKLFTKAFKSSFTRANFLRQKYSLLWEISVSTWQKYSLLWEISVSTLSKLISCRDKFITNPPLTCTVKIYLSHETCYRLQVYDNYMRFYPFKSYKYGISTVCFFA